jgi:hypothetical protein
MIWIKDFQTLDFQTNPFNLKKMSKKTKAFLFNLLGFTFFYIIAYALIITFGGLQGLWIAATSFVISTILAPKFQTVKTSEGEKLFMKWLFVKGLREIK